MNEITLVVEQRTAQVIEITPATQTPSVQVGTMAYVPVPGPQGEQGPAGVDGKDGAPGAPGAPGAQGPAGADGVPGPQGIQGIQGIQGPAGPAGVDGKDGAPGATGPQGEVGPTGPEGQQGPAGPQGAQGPAGPQGPKGDTGLQGAQGIQGPKGDTGATGAKGDKGDKGDTGAQGPQGLTGAKGDKGDTGEQGPQGIQGPTGPQGPAGGEDANVIDLMARLGAKVGAARANTLGRPLNIFAIGDSLTEGMGDANGYPAEQRFVARLQQWLDQATGRPMGRGMIQGATYSYPLNKYLIDTGGTYESTTPWFRSASQGIFLGFGSNTMLTQTNGATATFPFNGTGVAVEVPTFDPSIAGALNCTVDGVSVGTISLAYATSWKPKLQAFTGLSNGPHTLVMTAVLTAGQYAGYMGVMELTGNNGVWIHALGVGGTTSWSWSNMNWADGTALDAVDSLGTYCGGIDLVLLMLGGNDILNSISKADYITMMTTVITHFTAAGIPVIVWGGGTFDESSTAVPDGINALYEEYITAAGAVAVANGGAFYNFLPKIKGGVAWTQAAWAASGLNGDALHYNPAGHAFQAQLFAAQSPFRELLAVQTPATQYAAKALAADVTCTTAGTWYDGPSVTLAPGTWLLTGQLTMGKAAATADVMYGRLSTGSVHYASAQAHCPATNPHAATMQLQAVVVLTAATTIKLQGTSSVVSALIKAALTANGAGNNATMLQAVRLA